jgi:glycine betaine/choline ABC-type transport system substrate-binding protein
MTTGLGEIVQPTLTTLLILENKDLRSNKYVQEMFGKFDQIRNAISEGNMPLANEYLGNVTIFLSGTVFKGK